ncbi:MAG: hypothetical protein IJF66_00035, partial [Clostridia bacterium]|nr:hypothetical protein [Clostridia bacterium]
LNQQPSELLVAKAGSNAVLATWGLKACYPQLSLTKQGDTACAFLGSPANLEISESNLAL